MLDWDSNVSSSDLPSASASSRRLLRSEATCLRFLSVVLRALALVISESSSLADRPFRSIAINISGSSRGGVTPFRGSFALIIASGGLYQLQRRRTVRSEERRVRREGLGTVRFRW